MNLKFKKLKKSLKEKLTLYGYNDIDEEMLNLYVENLEICEEMKKDIEQYGYFVIDPKKSSRVPSPAWIIYKQASATILALGKQMGITAFGRKSAGQQASEDLTIDEILKL